MIAPALVVAGRLPDHRTRAPFGQGRGRQRIVDAPPAVGVETPTAPGPPGVGPGPVSPVRTPEIDPVPSQPGVEVGALILEEGISQRGSDIDTVWLNGYGWPAWTGGPMYWANHIGLATVVAGLEEYGLPVAPLLARKAAAGEAFD